ncbi:MAG: bifunctional DNA-formamidopyrimidine glycosylase/DNA-(apurinic or apyrimidinic site) lyase [Phycisphaerales bacterium]|nr:bifunctional DNA-formamidopyrimidine glycosylase/DNA-(apurinic or apyrimidinic site) lyase [Phycisphaerales bacterium]
MPELPEVQTVVNTIAGQLIGRRIAGIAHHRQTIIHPRNFNLAGHLVGARIQSVHRRAKRIIFELNDNRYFYIHLGMTGHLSVQNSDAPVLKHTHLMIDLAPKSRRRSEKPAQLRFCDPRRFGGLFWLGGQPDTGDLGPEPLTMTARQLAKRLHQTARPIKNALMDQKLIAGLGNIYVDESLFASHIHPRDCANRLSLAQITELLSCIKRILRSAIRHRGSSVRDYRDGHGRAGEYQNLHRVYGRTGAACIKCSTPIQRMILGGRSTHFCPQCQKLRQ